MTPADAQAFGDLWDAASERMNARPLSPSALAMTFEDLAQYDFAEIEAAVRAHCRKPGEQWMPKVGDIVMAIEGAVPSAAELIALGHAAATDKRATPLGKFVRLLLGVDLQNLHPKAAESRIAAALDRVRDFHARALVGEFTATEIRMLVAAGIDPAGALGPETAGPRAPYREAVRRRAAEARQQRAISQDEKPAASHRTKAAIEARDDCLAAVRQMLGGGEPVSEPLTEQQRMERREQQRVSNAKLQEARDRVLAAYEAEHGRPFVAPVGRRSPRPQPHDVAGMAARVIEQQNAMERLAGDAA